MNSSEKIDQLAASLYAIQRELKQPAKDAEAKIPTKSGGTYTIRFLSLPALLEFLGAKLDAVSLSYSQEITGLDNGIGVTTRIMHSSGQWVELGPLPVPCAADAQSVGSAITYGRRYALCAAFGISADEDDDGASATDRSRASAKGTQEPEGAGDGGGPEPEAGPAGEGEALAYGEGVSSEPTPPARSNDAAAAMEEFHPGKPHRMRISETVPSLMVCVQASPAQYGCAYTQPAKATSP